MTIGKGIVVISGGLAVLMLIGLYFFLDTIPAAPATSQKADEEVSITHSSKDGVQRYIGEITLGHSCFTLNQDTRLDPKDDGKRLIILTSIDKMLDTRLCSAIPTKYPFDILAEGDGAVTISLTLNGKELPVRIREREWQNPIGNTVLDPIDRNK